jgi:hypothetical protein
MYVIDKNVGITPSKSRILDLIAENNNELTTTDLVRQTGLHRDTVYVNCKELIEEGYINKRGKKGVYYLTLKSFNQPNLRGQNFVREVTKTMRMYGVPFIKEQEIESLFDKYSDLKDIKQQQILSFSLSMGAYITYVFLQSLNPNDWIFSSLTDNKQKWDKGMDALSKQEKDEVVRSWIKSAVNPLYLLMQFKRLNIVKRHDFDRLIKSYSQIFPDLYKQFEDINRRMNEPQKERSEEEIYAELDSGYYDNLDRKKKFGIKSDDDDDAD